MKKVDVIIIGAGTSGLTARREIAKKTQSYLVIDNGPLGTTCARVGCMPSKVLIQVSNDFHQAQKLSKMQLLSSVGEVDKEATMKHVRSLRDRFVRGVLSAMPEWEDKLIRGHATFIDDQTVEVNGEKIQADKFVIAAGSRPIVPGPWKPYEKFFIDTDSFFELEKLPNKVLVVGLGVIGLEIGQALSRIGIDVTGVSRGRGLGGLTDPEIQNYAFEKLKQEFPTFENGVEFVGDANGQQISADIDGKVHQFDKVILSVGRRPNIDKIGIEKLGITLNKAGLPEVDPNTLEIKEKPHMFLPGDVNATKPILHEAADEGKIAGYNCVHDRKCFKRRVNLGITFCEPNIASAGQRYADIIESKVKFVTGKVSFEGQGRSIVKLKEQGMLHVYVAKKGGLILGAELQAPDGEHLAHLLSWAISLKLTVFEALKMPFYHPVIEEGLRTALRNAANQITEGDIDELFRCEDPPIR